MPLLADQGWRVTAFDTPGYGLSDPCGSASISGYAENLARVMTALGIEHAALVGHHTGALIVGCCAAEYPQITQAVVLDNAPLYTPEERRERLARPHEPLAILPDGAHFIERWSYMRRVADPAMSDASIHLAVLEYFAAGGDDGHRAAFAYDFTTDLGAIKSPTLAIASARDPLFVHGRRIIEFRPNTSLVELPGGTATVLEDPVRWSRTVIGFLADKLA